jgi:hypothetical protein
MSSKLQIVSRSLAFVGPVDGAALIEHIADVSNPTIARDVEIRVAFMEAPFYTLLSASAISKQRGGRLTRIIRNSDN